MQNNLEVILMEKKMVKKYAYVSQADCVACGSCIKVCPRGAITVPKGIYAVVDRDLCVGCGICAKACPASIIEEVQL